MLETIVLAIVSAILYAGSAFMKKNFNHDNPQSFDTTKFASTLLVSAVIAVSMIAAGINTVTEADIATQLALYAGMVALVENVIKAVYRKVVVA